jgi:hypothetical protein
MKVELEALPWQRTERTQVHDVLSRTLQAIHGWQTWLRLTGIPAGKLSAHEKKKWVSIFTTRTGYSDILEVWKLHRFTVRYEIKTRKNLKKENRKTEGAPCTIMGNL